MANQEQLAILHQGVDVWNEWRRDNPNEKINLTRAQLEGVFLENANLSKANLKNAHLLRARLKEANLSDANLEVANLVQADLTKANLRNSHLFGCSLTEANLEAADLRRANLRGTDLWGAHLGKANLKEADLSRADLRRADLRESNLMKAYLDKAILRGADLWKSNLESASLEESDLKEAHLEGVYLRGGNLTEAVLLKAHLDGANLRGANLRGADLRGAFLRDLDLRHSVIVQAKIDDAIISGSKIYGISVWDLIGEFQEQKDLVITPGNESRITVDNIKVAQFVYLLLNNMEIRGIINTLTSKTVLILGRFTPERKIILDALRNKLREYDFLPIVFDFDRPIDKDFTETIKTLAGLCYFVVADVTNPKSSPLELQATVPDYQIPFVPIIQEGEYPFAMMVDLQNKYDWVLKTISYDSQETLMKVLKPLIIDPAMKKRQELRIIKVQEPEIISGKEFLNKHKK